MENFGDMEIKLTEESIAAMSEFSAALNHFSDEMSKAVVVFQEFQSAQHRVQRIGLWERIQKWLAQFANR